MAGGQVTTSGQGSVVQSLTIALVGLAIASGAGTIIADAGAGVAVSGSESASAQGSASSVMLVGLRSRKVGGGAAAHALTGIASTTGQTAPGPVVGKVQTGSAMTASAGSFGKTRSLALTGSAMTAVGESLLITTVPSAPNVANWVTRFARDFEDGAVGTGNQQLNGGALTFSNVTSPVIAGARSLRIQTTAFPAGAQVAALWSLAELTSAAQFVKRFRATIKVRATTTSTTLLIGVRCTSGPQQFLYCASKQPTVTTTPQTLVFDFIWPYAGSGEMRIDATEVSDVIVDDFLFEEDTNFTFIGADTGAIPEEFFGVHFNQATAAGHVNGPSLEYKMVRAWELASWRFIESNVKGTFSWTYLDRLVQECQTHGAKLMFVGGYTPNWATSNAGTPSNSTGGIYPGSNLLAVNVQDEVDFITAVINRYLNTGVLKYYEQWNEANDSRFLSAPMATFVARCQTIYNTVKALDPTITVIGANVGAGPGARFLSNYIDAGGNSASDAYSYHDYFHTGFKSQIANAYNYKQVLVRAGINKPLWMTEGSPSGYVAGATPQSMSGMTASGVKGFAYYTIEGIYAANTALAEPSTTLLTNTPLGNEINRYSSWVKGTNLVEAYAANGIWHFVLDRPQGAGKRIILWTDGAGKQVKGLAAWGVNQVTDLNGNVSALTFDASNKPIITVGPSPVMVQASGSFLSWTAEANATGYRVYWGTVSGIPYANSVNVGNVTSVASSSSFPGIGAGTRYFSIRSYDASGLEGPYRAEITKTI